MALIVSSSSRSPDRPPRRRSFGMVGLLLFALAQPAAVVAVGSSSAGCAHMAPEDRAKLEADAVAFGWKGVGDILGAALELATGAPTNPNEWATWGAKTGSRFGKNTLLGAADLINHAPPETLAMLVARQSLPPAEVGPRTIGFHPSSGASGTHASSTDGALGLTAGPPGASSGEASAGTVSTAIASAGPSPSAKQAARWLVEHPDAW